MEAKIRAKMQAVAKAVERELPKGAGFFVMAYAFSDTPGQRAQYVSNSNREEVIRMMKDFLERNPMPKPEDN